MEIDIQKIASLAKLRLREDEAKQFEQQLKQTLETCKDLPELDIDCEFTDENKPMKLRDDKALESTSRELLLQNAPQVHAGCVVVPKTRE